MCMKKILLLLAFLIFGFAVTTTLQARAEDGEQERERTQEQTRYADSENEIEDEIEDRQEMKEQKKEKHKVKIGKHELETDLEVNTGTLQATLSNGRKAEIKVMPETASQTAIEKLQSKFCENKENEIDANECKIELKEVGQKDEAKLAYKIETRKEVKIL